MGGTPVNRPGDPGIIVQIARCPDHGLHGSRETCFECGGPVEQIAMVPVNAGGCPFCFGNGWVLDANDAGMKSPKSLELIPCFHPECESSGAPIASLVFKGPKFIHKSVHPIHRYVMSVSS